MYLNYRMFKPSFGADPYYLVLPQNYMFTILRFRTTNNNLPVNKLRYENIPRNDRICDKCNMHDVADDFYYLFVWMHLVSAPRA